LNLFYFFNFKSNYKNKYISKNKFIEIDDIMNQTGISLRKPNIDVENDPNAIEVDKNNQDFKVDEIVDSKVDSKINRIRKCFKEGIMNSTIHALPKIMMADKLYSKIMWILFFIISFGFNIQLIGRCITDYLSYETITKIDIGSEQPGN
jgi:hypothetical protein